MTAHWYIRGYLRAVEGLGSGKGATFVALIGEVQDWLTGGPVEAEEEGQDDDIHIGVWEDSLVS